WWLAVTLAVPGVILMLAASVTVGLAIWVQRLDRLISLHHQFAGAPAKTDSNRSKTNAFRKSRPSRAPNPRNRPAKYRTSAGFDASFSRSGALTCLLTQVQDHPCQPMIAERW